MLAALLLCLDLLTGEPGRPARFKALLHEAEIELGSGGIAGTVVEGAVRAEAKLVEALALVPDDVRALERLAQARALQGKREAAAVTLERGAAVATTPAEEARLWVQLGRVRALGGEHAFALEAYDNALRTGAAERDAQWESAGVLLALGRPADAETRLRDVTRQLERDNAAARHPAESTLVGLTLAVALDLQGRGPAADERAVEAVRTDPALRLLPDGAAEGAGTRVLPSAPLLAFARGLALQALGRNGEARASFARVLALAPARDPLALRARARGDGGVPAQAPAAPARPARVRLVAAATVHTEGALAAPLVDAAFRGRPDLVTPCLDKAPPSLSHGGRIALLVTFASNGTVRTVSVIDPPADAAALVSCLESRVRDGLRVPGDATPPRPSRGKSKPRAAPESRARIELLLAGVPQK